MSSVADTVRICLLHRPQIFPNPLRVLDHVFCAPGSGYAWKKGELVYGYPSENAGFDGQMRYDDLDPSNNRYMQELEREDPEMAALVKAPNPARDLERMAKRVQREFIAQNIEQILQAPLTKVYFGNPHELGPFMSREVDPKDQPAFSFPSNIKPDWAKALWDFLGHWDVSLGQVHGVGQSFEDNQHWPAEAKQTRLNIRATRARLRQHAFPGVSDEQYKENLGAIINVLSNAGKAPRA